MIFINRDRVPSPKILDSARVRKEKEKLVEYYQRKQMYKQAKYQIRVLFLRKCRPELEILFYNKCCYCESSLGGVTAADIENFRPKASAINLDGTIHEGYWWLVYEWFNLYLACPKCNRAKANRFPVQGKRLKYPQKDSDLENYLLIDPCREKDHKEKHFQFSEDGQIIPLTQRGEVTIKVIGLNRQNLIYARQKWANHIKIILENILLSSASKSKLTEVNDILNLLKDEQPYLGLTRELIKGWFLKYGSKILDINPNVYQEIKRKLKLHIPLQKKKYKFKVKKEYNLGRTDQSSKRAYFSEFKRIERVEIENFKIIDQATICFPEPPVDEIGDTCIMLIGENAVGKSSILQAIGLALIGEEKANQLDLDAKKLVRRGRGIAESRVSIYLSDRPKPLKMTISKRTGKIRITSKGPQVIVVGYGSLRTLPEKKNEIKTEIDPINVEGLYRQRATLRDVESWLGNRKRVKTSLFKEIASTVIDLLMIEPDATEKRRILYRYRSQVKVNLFGEPEYMKDMCDGYKSVLAYSLDIMMTLTSRWKSIQDAEAVVMIDEIGVNLHPSWKINIISLLRKVFPRVSFIITTHDPLCLRGARKGEIYAMNRKIDGKGILINQIDIPPGTSIEQLLLGMWFKMDSTMDHDTRGKLVQHAQLVLEKSDKNKKIIFELEKVLEERFRISGDNTLFGRFKQTFYEVVDEAEKEISEKELMDRIKIKLQKQLRK